MDGSYAFVTLVTSDHYLPGALAVAAALKDLHPSPPVSPEVSFQTACLVTPESVDVSTIKLLRTAFDIVIGVEIIEQEDKRGLQLLGRLDLNTVLTKLHIFRLSQYAKIIFLDADVLPVRPMSHLFTIPYDFAAVPDVGWPDIFNSGVLVFTPGEDKFNELRELFKSKGSWDGGDQGILNEWRGGDWHRLSFTYNTTPTAVYTYAPAYERFGSQISAIHFIGPNKPWVSITYRPPGMKYSAVTGKNADAQQSYDYDSLVDRWFDVYDRHYRSDLDPAYANFEFTHYDSVWDTGTNYGADIVSSAFEPQSGAALGLDDLRKIAVEGMNSYSTTQAQPKVGEYRSLPLDGRVDLMRPRKLPPPAVETPKEEGSRDQSADQNLTPKQAFTVLQGGEVPNMDNLPASISQSPPAPYHRLPVWPHSALSAPQPAMSVPGRPYLAQPTTDLYFLAPDTSYYLESEQSDDQEDNRKAASQPPLKATESQRVRLTLPYLERPHRKEHLFTRHGHFSPRGIHSPRGQQSPTQSRHSPAQSRHSPIHSRHSPTQSRHSPPPAIHPDSGQSQQHHIHDPHHHHHPSQHPAVPAPQVQPQLARGVRHVSPPMLEWNAAIDPPPKTPPPPSAFPPDTYFPNIWDQAPNHGRDISVPAGLFSAQSEILFHPPPPSEIPEQLLLGNQYENVIGHVTDAPHPSPPAPDRKKVHAVFPWEEKPRPVPRRVFPASESPPPVANFIEENVPVNKPPLTHTPISQRLPGVPPPIGLPFGLTYSNAWDTVPSIQKYATKLVRPHHSVFQPPPPDHDESWRKWDEEREREYQDRQDASSMDGDDEDEGDEDGNDGHLVRLESDVDKDRNQSRRSRAGSNASTSGKGKRYRARGVQTILIETRSMGVQVDGSADETDSGRKGKRSPRTSGSSAVGSLLAGITLKADPSETTAGILAMNQPPHTSLLPFPSKASPLGSRSPQTLGSPHTFSPPRVMSPKGSHSPKPLLSTKTPPRRPASPKTSATSRRVSGSHLTTSNLAGSPQTSGSPTIGPSTSSSPRQSPIVLKLNTPFSPPLHRMSSNDTTLTSSPSTTGPIETPEGTPVLGSQSLQPAKPGRVWDPARDVDVFKRSSEEVLARFLRSGSFEEEDDGQKGHI